MAVQAQPGQKISEIPSQKKKKKKVWHGGVHLQSFVIRATQELWIAGSQLRPAQAKVRAYQKNNLKHKELEAWLK
jgi:hypothetical protein